MRRRQAYARIESPAPSRAGDTAPEAGDDRSPPPVADKLTYRSRAGALVMIRATNAGLELWNGSQWVPAHVMPSKRGRDG